MGFRKDMEGLTMACMQFPTTDTILRPKSNPEYYNNLIKELEEAPTRSWLTRVTNRLKGMIRI